MYIKAFRFNDAPKEFIEELIESPFAIIGGNYVFVVPGEDEEKLFSICKKHGVVLSKIDIPQDF
jgi:hypothetical protein